MATSADVLTAKAQLGDMPEKRRACIGGYCDYTFSRFSNDIVNVGPWTLNQPSAALQGFGSLTNRQRFVVQAKPLRQALNLGSDLE